jgi:G3E family GTPase
LPRIPATIVTGFLGAGKTSLVRHLLVHAGGRRLAVLVNEFGELGIGREVLLGCGDAACTADAIVELANGCLCCTVAEDFLPALLRLLDRDAPPAHILIETSGLALPKPLVQAFAWPEFRTRTTVDGVLTAIDGDAAPAGRFAADPAAIARQHAADPALAHDDHDDFESFVVTRAPAADGGGFLARLREVIRRHGVLRVKGFVAISGSERRHGVGDRLGSYFDRPWAVGERRDTRRVVIGGRGLDRPAIAAALG